MTIKELYFPLLYLWIFISLITLIVLIVFKPATYGKHVRKKGFFIDNKLGWFIMELPTLLLIPVFFFSGLNYNMVTLCFIILYLIHYCNRVLIFPFRLKTKGKKIPLLIVLSAMFFNLCNTFFIGYYFGHFSLTYDLSWFWSPQFIIGCMVFCFGAYINHQSDTTLINLRKGSEIGYKIPSGGLFNYVSCPNHLGEIIEWFGFAILTWSLPGFAFAFWTLSNLLPRSIQHHNWYKKKFVNYPKVRKAIIPFLI